MLYAAINPLWSTNINYIIFQLQQQPHNKRSLVTQLHNYRIPPNSWKNIFPQKPVNENRMDSSGIQSTTKIIQPSAFKLVCTVSYLRII